MTIHSMFFRIVLAGCASLVLGPQALDVRAAGLEQFNHGGHVRQYLMHIPPSYRGDSPVPLVMVLHGGMGNAERMERQTGFSALADREGFLVVYPNSVKGEKWNDGRSTVESSGIDDVSFLVALVDHLARKYNIDRRRVYSTGISNGGGMTYRLACEASDRFAAYAAVSVNLSNSLRERCRPSSRVAMMIINGLDDPIMPWAGGEVKGGRKYGKGGYVLSTPETADFWARNAGCSPNATHTDLPDKDQNDGTHVERRSYVGCPQGREVILWAIHGGGHAWPGSPERSGPIQGLIAGRTSRDVSAAEIIWDFFRTHQLQ